MVTAIFYFPVFLQAILAKWELIHGSTLPIIWYGVYNCKTGTAIGASSEGVLIASIWAPENFFQTVITHRQIGGDY
jgi:hypothetical protein